MLRLHVFIKSGHFGRHAGHSPRRTDVLTEPFNEARVFTQASDGNRPTINITRSDEDSVNPIAHEFCDATKLRSNHRHARGKGLKYDQGARLEALRRHGQEIVIA